MAKKFMCVCIGILALLVLAVGLVMGSYTAVFAGIRAGVEVPESTAPPGPSTSDPSPFAVVINFDEDVEPCLFIETNPLRTKYQALGVTFSGANPLDGGAILDECSNFDVTGHSSPNFLAFNCESQMANGGTPCTPEYIDFESTVTDVSALVGVGHNITGTVTMHAYDGSGNLVDSDVVNVSSQMQRITVSGCGIVRVVINQNLSPPPDYDVGFALDDLAFDFGASGTDPSTWGKIKAEFQE